jgi:putative ABC transport system ATP-binding protein
MPDKPAIQIHQLAKSYQESDRLHEVFSNLQLSVAPGEFIVLLGRSGSGKSTLLNLISGIDKPSSGEIIINNTNLTDLSEHQRTMFRRRHIGFIFQFYNLIPTLTVAENLLLPLELLNGIKESDRQKVSNLLKKLELSARIDTYPERLSGGEQQRVAIARALIHQPDLILADEPTGNLDLQTGEQVLGLLDEMVREAGKTLIMATHSTEVIGRADRVISIKDNQLVNI